MLDMGFIRDIRKVLEVLPARRQNLLFSATFSEEIRSLARGFLHDPASVQVTPKNSAAPLVTQVVHPVDRERKRELLAHLIRTGVVDQALVFTRTKHGANRLAQQLERDGIAAVAIHGNKSQGQRVRALADFKTGRTPILVATEIAARGLDIIELPHVVNYELPMVPEDYVHRIGRTGRAGTPGLAVSLVCVDEEKLLREIERVLGAPIPKEVIAGFEPDRSVRPEPILRGGLGRSRPEPRVARGGFPSRGGSPVRAGSPSRDGTGFAPARRPSMGAHPGAGRPVGPSGGGGGGRPSSGRHGGGRPSVARPGQTIGNGRPMPDRGETTFRGPRRPGDRPGMDHGNGHAPGRPVQGRGQQGRPAQGRPGQDHGRGRPDSGRPGQRPAGQPNGRPQSMPGERFSRG